MNQFSMPMLIPNPMVLRIIQSNHLGPSIILGWVNSCLPYDVIRTSNAPDETLLNFLQSTYEAAATSADWDRNILERQRVTTSLRHE